MSVLAIIGIVVGAIIVLGIIVVAILKKVSAHLDSDAIRMKEEAELDCSTAPCRPDSN